MITQIQKDKYELNEKLEILKNGIYPEWLERIILKDTLNILTEYDGDDFTTQMNRYLIMERKYK